MSSIEPVTFRNGAGLKLFGTFHKPAQALTDAPAIVLLSPGVKMRMGPGRLYVPLTRMLNSLGYAVLRFDFFGLGDSEGELPETMLADVYNNIEVGRYVDDTLSALKWLADTHGFQRFVLGGLCGGAITAILAAQRDKRVEGLLSIGMTVTLASNAASAAKYMTRSELDERRRGYYRRLLQPQSWLRLLTFQSDYRIIWQSMRRLIVKDRPAAPVPAPAAAAAQPGATQQAEQRGNANPLFPPAFFEFLQRGGKALMLFSEKDRLQAEYEEKFAEVFAQRLSKHAAQIEKHVIANANHVLALHEWQREMVEISKGWVSRLGAART